MSFSDAFIFFGRTSASTNSIGAISAERKRYLSSTGKIIFYKIRKWPHGYGYFIPGYEPILYLDDEEAISPSRLIEEKGPMRKNEFQAELWVDRMIKKYGIKKGATEFQDKHRNLQIG